MTLVALLVSCTKDTSQYYFPYLNSCSKTVDEWIENHIDFDGTPFSTIEKVAFLDSYYSYPDLGGALILGFSKEQGERARSYINYLIANCAANHSYDGSDAEEILNVFPERVRRRIDFERPVRIDLTHNSYRLYFSDIIVDRNR